MNSLKSQDTGSEIIDRIDSHTRTVFTGGATRQPVRCSHCRTRSRKYRFCGRRRRALLVVDKCWVRQVTTFLAHWQCMRCGRAFTDYPDFAVPYRRYAGPTILRLCRRYMTDKDMSYTEAVKYNHMAIAYEGNGLEIDERQLSPGTLRDWVENFSKLFPRSVRGKRG